MANNNLQLQNGELLLEEYQPDGTLGGMIPFGGTDVIGFSVSVDKLEHNNTEDTEQVLDGNDVIKRTVSLSVETRDITNEMLERAHLASSTTVTQTAATDEAVVLSAVKLGQVAEIGYRDITALEVKDSTDATTYIEGTDYTYNRKWGTLIPLSGGSIVDGADLHLTLSVGAVSGKMMTAMASDRKEYRMTFQGMSSKGIYTKYVFEKVDLSLDGDAQLKNTDTAYSALTFTGAALKYNGKYYSIETFSAA
ncbi:hypothetical protein [Sulfurovum sp.]|uniref:phage tail tube protein n=1 Tax=Sulfurovum sp. TaxID=1969726 RepID=UPI0026306141|nr:hypothetical protein [Sulfurovum sp.]